MKTKILIIIVSTLFCVGAWAQSFTYTPRPQPQYGTVTTVNPYTNQVYTTPYTITPQRPAPSIGYSFDSNGQLSTTLNADPWTVVFGSGGSGSDSDD